MSGRHVQWYPRRVDLPGPALALLESAGSADLYQHPAWLDNLIDQVSFAPGHSPGFAVLVHGSAARIVLPLLQPAVPAALAPRGAMSLANYYSPLAQPASAPGADADADDWHQLFDALRRGLAGPLDSLRLGPLDLSHPQASALQQGLDAAGWRTQRYLCFGNWYQPLTGVDAAVTAAERWPLYWARREGALRNTAARMGRRFAKAGGRFQVVTGGSDPGEGAGAEEGAVGDSEEMLERAIAAYADVYAHSWKSTEPHPGFMPGLMRTAAAHGWLRLGLAWLGRQPVAAQVWLVQGRQASIYKLAYRDDAAGYSPGTLLTAHLMQRVLAEPTVEEVDYGMGDDPYKQQWMGHRRERWGLEALNPARAGGRWLQARRWAARRFGSGR